MTYVTRIYGKMDAGSEPDAPPVVKQLVLLCKVGALMALAALVLVAVCGS